MKKGMLSIILAIVISISSVPITNIGTQTVQAATKKKVKLSKSKATVTVGKTVKVKLKNVKEKVTWKVVKGSKYVKIKKKSGKYKNTITIYGKKAGSATIQAKYNNKKYKVKVTVKKKKTVITEATTTKVEKVTTKTEQVTVKIPEVPVKPPVENQTEKPSISEPETVPSTEVRPLTLEDKKEILEAYTELLLAADINEQVTLDLSKYQLTANQCSEVVDYLSYSLFSECYVCRVYSNNYKQFICYKQLENKEGKARLQTLQNILNKVPVKEDMSDLEKVLTVHDYLALTTEYDATNISSYNIYGTLTNKTASCQGYTFTFKCLMNYFNIQSGWLSYEKYTHGWNTINVGGKWYHIDITGDQKASEDFEVISYYFFLVPDSQLRDFYYIDPLSPNPWGNKYPIEEKHYNESIASTYFNRCSVIVNGNIYFTHCDNNNIYFFYKVGENNNTLVTDSSEYNSCLTAYNEKISYYKNLIN